MKDIKKAMRKSKPLTEEHKKNVSLGLMFKYKKDVVSYAAYHMRVYRKRGRANKCEHCHTLTASKYEWANTSGNYQNIDDYIQLCTSCHIMMDGRNHNISLNYKQMKCQRCGMEFKRRSGGQKYCGSIKTKEGCAYKRFNEYHSTKK